VQHVKDKKKLIVKMYLKCSFYNIVIESKSVKLLKFKIIINSIQNYIYYNLVYYSLFIFNYRF